ncbi:MAG: DUF2281 domain-containing protein [Oscillospiraceae bacterium]|nr:DUF2281 domain-containing protein [Oscillospiraceae bacterium]
MYAINAIYDGINFKPIQPVPVQEDYKVVITFIEPVKRIAVRPPFEFGCLEGKVVLPDDFDEPLEDMRERRTIDS